MAVIEYIFGAASFVPHGFCLAWRPDLVALHAISDTLIALAYFAIPAAIITFVRRRDDLQPAHVRLAVLFVAFILACGITHLMGLVTLWYPAYGLDGLMKFATALVSVATAVMLWPLIPVLVSLPSQSDLRAANRRLSEEVEAHQRTMAMLRESHRDLETRVEERTRDLAIASRRLEMTLRGSAITVFEQDANLKYLWIFNPPPGYPLSDLIGRADYEVLPEGTAAQVIPVKERVLKTGVGEMTTASLQMADGTHWFEMRVEPAVDSSNHRTIASVAVDVTEKRKAERHLRLMMRELTHRSKNLLAIVQSLAWQTAKSADGLEAFADSFAKRLAGLAQSHDLLVSSDWRGASMADLITAQLEVLSHDQEQRIERSGPDLQLYPSNAQNLGLALHELVTNSIKYGALSHPSGRVAITWGQVDGSEPPVVRLTWAEADGPAVAAPARSGFGRIMLERLVPRALRGEAKLDFTPTGLIWTLTVPLKVLQPDEPEANGKVAGEGMTAANTPIDGLAG